MTRAVALQISTFRLKTNVGTESGQYGENEAPYISFALCFTAMLPFIQGTHKADRQSIHSPAGSQAVDLVARGLVQWVYSAFAYENADLIVAHRPCEP